MSREQTIVFDGHVHVYPAWKLSAALNALFANLARCAPPSEPAPVRVGLLADHAACRGYRGRIGQPRLKQVDEFILQPSDEAGAMIVRDEDRVLGYVLAGRQIVTADRLVVLSLASDADVADGLPLDQTLTAIRGNGGVPVLNWAPGLWTGARGQLVRKAVENSTPTDFLLGDSALRPSGWPEPAGFKLGRRRGLRIVRGTDALLLSGETRRLGTCATVVRGPWDPAHPVTSLRHLLTTASYPLTPAGRRLSLSGFAIRWARRMMRAVPKKEGA